MGLELGLLCLTYRRARSGPKGSFPLLQSDLSDRSAIGTDMISVQMLKATIWKRRGNSSCDLQVFERESLISCLDYFCLISSFSSTAQPDPVLQFREKKEGKSILGY